jgi:hypothetical protein
MQENLRAPSWKLVLQWGRQLLMNPTDIMNVSEKLQLRHALGKKITPPPPHSSYWKLVRNYIIFSRS